MLRCSNEAFAQCPTRALCGSPQEATFVEGSECDRFNQEVAEKPLTNGARIRAMSDAELADFFLRGPMCNADCWALFELAPAPCNECLLHWLSGSEKVADPRTLKESHCYTSCGAKAEDGGE